MITTKCWCQESFGWKIDPVKWMNEWLSSLCRSSWQSGENNNNALFVGASEKKLRTTRRRFYQVPWTKHVGVAVYSVGAFLALYTVNSGTFLRCENSSAFGKIFSCNPHRRQLADQMEENDSKRYILTRTLALLRLHNRDTFLRLNNTSWSDTVCPRAATASCLKQETIS